MEEADEIAAGANVAARDLLGHTIVSASAVSPTNEWRYGSGKNAVTVRVHPRLVVTNNAPALPIHVVHLQDRLLLAKVRNFLDVLVEQLRSKATLAAIT